TYMFLSAAMVMPAIVIQEASPPAMRARLMATHLLSLGLLGQGLGPFIVARMSDQIGGIEGLPKALILIALVAPTIAMIFAWLMHRRIDQTKFGMTASRACLTRKPPLFSDAGSLQRQYSREFSSPCTAITSLTGRTLSHI